MKWIAIAFVTLTLAAQPQLKRSGTATQLLVDGKPFLILGGELHNSSASSLEYMRTVMPRLNGWGMNTVLATVSWELLEREEGRFDYALVDGPLREARARNLRLVLLWFGSWKNGVSTYAPLWVKADVERFPRARDRQGKPFDVITPVSDAARDADARAFAALMRHLKEADGAQQTVLMVQVENEVGLLGDSRDRSPQAEAVWGRAVPKELLAALKRSAGTWPEVFGNTPEGDETFMAWHYARYIDRVTEAGKREYPLPMYVNAWLVQYPGEPPGRYPSGGPVAKVMDIWKAAAPHIDLMAPDIYLPDFRAVCAEFARAGNALFIPEARPDRRAGARAFYAFGRHDAIGFSPFGIDGGRADLNSLGEAYRMLSDLAPLIAEQQGKGTMTAFLQQEREDKATAELGGYRWNVNYPEVKEGDTPQGYALVIGTGKDEFVVAGAAVTIRFASAAEGQTARIGSIDEGRYIEGKWSPMRRLNGDENGGGEWLRLPPGMPTMVRLRLYRVR